MTKLKPWKKCNASDFWMIKNPAGEFLCGTIGFSREFSIKLFIKYYDYEDFKEAKRAGFRAVKIRIMEME